jgi:hypothetical protein
MKSIAGKFVLIIIIVGVAIQFIPVGRSNPPVEEEILTPPQVKTILKRACYDCHSHETKWPWYSQVAPASWLLAWDVHEGREELNFSTWNRYSPKKRKKFIKEIWEEVEEREMPVWSKNSNSLFFEDLPQTLNTPPPLVSPLPDP